MVEKAGLVVVGYRNLHTLEPLEVLQHQMRDFNGRAVNVVSFLIAFEERS
jgi:hypothetical protein